MSGNTPDDAPTGESAELTPAVTPEPNPVVTAEAGTQARAAAAPPRAWWKVPVAIGGAVVSVIGALWTFYEIKDEFFADTSRHSSVTIAVQPYPATATEFAVPVTTDFGDFPDSDGTCSETQRTWLAEAGHAITSRLIVDLRNTASEGAMVVVKDFSVTGTRTTDDERYLRVICDSAPTPVTPLRSARLDATTPQGVAVLSANAFGATSDGLPDTPVAWNLAPGETGQLVIRVFSRAAVTGELVATVLVGESAQMTTVQGASITTLPLVDDGATYLNAGEGLRCVRETDDQTTECDLQDVVAQLTAGE